MEVDSYKVDVLLPCYNVQHTVASSIKSILDQTFGNYRLIIADDCSQDDTLKEVEGIIDSRIVVVRHESNLKLSRIINQMLHKTDAKYLIRMDADDLCYPDRFAKQVSYMDNHPEIDVCGSNIITSEGTKWVLPEFHDEICAGLIFQNSIVHPATIWRMEKFKMLNLKFDESLPYAQDYDFWTRNSTILKYHNLQEFLLEYNHNIHSQHKESQRSIAESIQQRYYQDIMTCCQRINMDSYIALSMLDPFKLLMKDQWFKIIDKCNSKSKIIEPSILHNKLTSVWYYQYDQIENRFKRLWIIIISQFWSVRVKLSMVRRLLSA